MKVLTVIGARPQFIKAARVSRALRAAGHCEILVHTGQHYDHQMSQVFFDELGIAKPEVHLQIGSGPHGQQTDQMMIRLEVNVRVIEPVGYLDMLELERNARASGRRQNGWRPSKWVRISSSAPINQESFLL